MRVAICFSRRYRVGARKRSGKRGVARRRYETASQKIEKEEN
jgi:hypothetical protein